MGSVNKRVYVRKPLTGFLYKWSPDNYFERNGVSSNSGNPVGCHAQPFSQGEDWVTTYVYKFTTDNVQHHFAYVECDYVS